MSVLDNKKVDQRAKGRGKGRTTPNNNTTRQTNTNMMNRNGNNVRGGATNDAGEHGHSHQHSIQSPGANQWGSWNDTAAAFSHTHEVMPGSEVDEPNMWGVAGPPRAEDWQGHNWNQTNVYSGNPLNEQQGPHGHPHEHPENQGTPILNPNRIRPNTSPSTRRGVTNNGVRRTTPPNNRRTTNTRMGSRGPNMTNPRNTERRNINSTRRSAPRRGSTTSRRY